MEFTSNQKRGFAWLAIALVASLLLWLLAPVLTPFLVGAVFAYALTPVVDRLVHVGRGRMPRLVAVVLVELLFIVILLSLLLLVIPILTKELPLLRDQIPLMAERLTTWAEPLLNDLGIPVRLDVASVKSFAIKYFSTNWGDDVGSLLASVRVGGSVALALVGNAVLIPIVLFYLLMDWHRFVGLLMDLVPPRLRASVNRFTSEADSVLGQYLRGQLLVMLVLAVYYSAGLALFRLDLALPIGIFTGLAVFVPYVGFGVGLTLASLAGLLQLGLLKALVMVVVVYGLGQVIESFFLTPRLVGERIGLHPLAVIFALLAFAQLFGFVGVLVALPASAVLLVAVRRVRESYMDSKLYAGSGPP